MSRLELFFSCRQSNGLQQHAKLADKAATEAAASFAQLQKRHDDLSEKLQDVEQKHSNAVHKAAADTHRQQMLVSAMHKPNTMKQPSCLIHTCVAATHPFVALIVLHKKPGVSCFGYLESLKKLQ